MNLSAGAEAGGAGNELLSVSFNQDSSCFACGTMDGFVVFNVQPFRETFRRVFASGSIGIVEMLYRCNLLAIVGGGVSPRYPPNKVMIWDDRQNRCVGELLFKTNVHAVRLRRDRVVVVLANKVHVHRFKDLKLLSQVATANNPRGIVAQNESKESHVLAVLGANVGTVRVELYDIGKYTVIKAHETELAALALSFDGSQLATASEKGTIIRTWDTTSGLMLRELRRGTDRAEIYSLAFDHACSWLACSSDKGTVHIFSLAGQSKLDTTAVGSTVFHSAQSAPATAQEAAGMGTAGADSQASSSILSGPLGYLQSVLPEAITPSYFSSEWSFAQLRGVEGKAIVSFEGSSSSRLVVLTEFGICTKCSVPTETGDCPRLAVNSFLRMEQSSGSSSSLNDGAAAADVPIRPTILSSSSR